jgi:hypothetical protein
MRKYVETIHTGQCFHVKGRREETSLPVDEEIEEKANGTFWFLHVVILFKNIYYLL